MEPTTLGAWGLIVMLGLIAVRVPIAFCMAFIGFFGIILAVGWPAGGEFDFQRGFDAAWAYIAFEPFSFIANFPIIAVPLFLMMGYVAFHAGFTKDIYYTARVWLSQLNGGLAMASVAGCAMFAAVSGSSLATAAAMGKLAVPEMLRYKYHPGIATGVVAASGTLGSLIPPSILMVLYGIFTEESIGQLLMAGLIPGVLSAAIYMGMVWIRATINPELAPKAESVSWADRFIALKGVWSILVLFLIVMGGIYSGIVTPTEAAAAGCAGAWILGFITRRLTKEASKDAAIETAKQVANVFALVLGAKIFVGFVALTGVAGDLTGWATNLDVDPIWILLSLSLVFVVLGTFMDPLGMMLLTLPVVTPVIQDLGYDLVWFGVIMVKFLEIGLITPPVGLNVYVLKGVVGDAVPLETIFKGILWFLAMDILTLVVLILYPEISLWLPQQIIGS
ncbi:MAG: TRAP transporter large permease [Pseudomonadota bacterium]|nr:TRAP transporter large permease [Pseudomonadota bacterium]MEC7396722.1 TRAP transporter large permease [Pseudomonadota bacterium]MEC8136345.1 TRAP transporter large permease [Pseudomonadota bacterium]MED6308972.1 TRAP transporter large permease [Pseudomonadota bacterium]